MSEERDEEQEPGEQGGRGDGGAAREPASPNGPGGRGDGGVVREPASPSGPGEPIRPARLAALARAAVAVLGPALLTTAYFTVPFGALEPRHRVLTWLILAGLLTLLAVG